MIVTLTAPDLAAVTARIARAEELFKRPEPLLKVWGVSVLALIGQNFRVGGHPRWAPLKPSTLAARRQGKGKGGGKPLENTGALRQSFDFRTGARQVTVFTNNPVAAFHEFGTHGPYEIRAKHGKALAIPTDPMTLSGLGRSTPTGRGSFTLAASGQKIPKRLAGRVGKTVVPFKSVIFRQKVTHPGLPARPMLPTPEQLVPALVRDADAFFAKVMAR